jgi:hypothetical protein
MRAIPKSNRDIKSGLQRMHLVLSRNVGKWALRIGVIVHLNQKGLSNGTKD